MPGTRLLERLTVGGLEIEFEYDGAGRVEEARRQSGYSSTRTRLQHDGAGHVLRDATFAWSLSSIPLGEWGVERSYSALSATAGIPGPAVPAPAGLQGAPVDVRALGSSTPLVVYHDYDEIGRAQRVSYANGTTLVRQHEGPLLTTALLANVETDGSVGTPILATERLYDDTAELAGFVATLGSGARQFGHWRDYDSTGRGRADFVAEWDALEGEWSGTLRAPDYDGVQRLSRLARAGHAVGGDAATVVDALAAMSQPATSPSDFTSAGLDTTITRGVFGTIESIAPSTGSGWVSSNGDGRALVSVQGQPLTWDGYGRQATGLGRTITWANDDQIVAIAEGSGAGAVVTGEIIDAFGRRVMVDDTRRTYLDGSLLVEDRDGWTRTWWPTPDLDRPAAYTIACIEPPCVTGPPAAFAAAAAFTADQQSRTFAPVQTFRNDTLLIVDESGAVVEAYRYGLRGELEILPPAAPTAVASAATCNSDTGACASAYGNTLLWAGAHWDSQVRLYDMRARRYDPYQGIFLSPDPLGYVDSFDEWLYAAGDPFNLWDPWGLKATNGPPPGFIVGEGTRPCGRGCQLATNISSGPVTTSLGNQSAGLGDVMSFGISVYLRDRTGWGATEVDAGSPAYTAGTGYGFIISLATGTVGMTGARVATTTTAQVATGATAGRLTSIGVGRWRTSAGLIYGPGSAHGNRVRHVLAHAAPDPTKPAHSVFNVARNQVLGLLDEAWAARGSYTIHPRSGNWNYRIPMGRVVGTEGEQAINISVRPGTAEIITAFPVP